MNFTAQTQMQRAPNNDQSQHVAPSQIVPARNQNEPFNNQPPNLPLHRNPPVATSTSNPPVNRNNQMRQHNNSPQNDQIVSTKSFLP